MFPETVTRCAESSTKQQTASWQNECTATRRDLQDNPTATAFRLGRLATYRQGSYRPSRGTIRHPSRGTSRQYGKATIQYTVENREPESLQGQSSIRRIAILRLKVPGKNAIPVPSRKLAHSPLPICTWLCRTWSRLQRNRRHIRHFGHTARRS